MDILLMGVCLLQPPLQGGAVEGDRPVPYYSTPLQGGGAVVGKPPRGDPLQDEACSLLKLLAVVRVGPNLYYSRPSQEARTHRNQSWRVGFDRFGHPEEGRL